MIGAMIVKIANLVEAEGRIARQTMYQWAVFVAALLVVSITFVGGMGFVALACYESLSGVLPRPAAGMVVGGVLMLAASITAWCMIRRTPGGSKPRNTIQAESPPSPAERRSNHHGDTAVQSHASPQEVSHAQSNR